MSQMNLLLWAALASFIGAFYFALVLTAKAWIPSCVLSVCCIVFAVSYLFQDRQQTEAQGRIICLLVAILSVGIFVLQVLD